MRVRTYVRTYMHASYLNKGTENWVCLNFLRRFSSSCMFKKFAVRPAQIRCEWVKCFCTNRRRRPQTDNDTCVLLAACAYIHTNIVYLHHIFNLGVKFTHWTRSAKTLQNYGAFLAWRIVNSCKHSGILVCFQVIFSFEIQGNNAKQSKQDRKSHK